jgi:hypothetical protein
MQKKVKSISMILAAAFLAVFIFPLTTRASHVGDYYDNRDSDHAKMATSSHPGLTYMASGYGVQSTVIPDKNVFGNSSTAYTTGYFWGSNVRVRHLRSDSTMDQSYNLYVNNNAYWYPEHQDHDTVDYYFAMSPTFNNSQGSSGSEIDELHKWFYTLDVFPEATKAKIVSSKLLIPTMQMLARRTRVDSDEAYMSGAAHPNAFDNFSNTSAMQAMASSMRADHIPPLAKLKLIEEDYNLNNDGLNFFEPSGVNSEIMFDNPASISRAWQGREYSKRMILSAEDSYDANGLPLTYHWSIIRGNSNQIHINSLDDASKRVEIIFDYHSEAPIEGSTRLSNLATVGLFVNNGHYYSAPAFVNSYTKRNETRVYDPVSKRLLSISYDGDKLDPEVSFNKSWTSDTFSYDSGGNLSGWKRLQNGVTYNFTKEGYYIDSYDSEAKPNMVSRVNYSYSSTDYLTSWSKSGSPFLYNVTTCTDWTYTAWGECVDGIRRRKILTSLPSGCYGGNPLLEERCDIFALGDVDHDGRVNSTDAMLTLRKAVGLPMSVTAWFESPTNGDVDCSGSVSSGDALLILRKSLGLTMTGTAWCE